jgi:hypothetical protein
MSNNGLGQSFFSHQIQLLQPLFLPNVDHSDDHDSNDKDNKNSTPAMMMALVSMSVPQDIGSVKKSRTRAHDQSVSPGCCAAHYQTPPKVRVSSEHLSLMFIVNTVSS